MSMRSQIWPVMVLAAGLAFVGASRADESLEDSAETDEEAIPA